MKKFKVKIPEDKLLAIVKDDKEKALSYYNTELRTKFQLWEALFNGDPDFYNTHPEYRMPNSKYVSRDIMVTIRAIMPDLVRLLMTNEPVDISGRTAEDMKKAQVMHALCNWQITQLNPFFILCNTIFGEALLKGLSVVKVIWEKTIEDKEFNEEMTEDEIDYIREHGADIKSSKFMAELPDGSYLYNVTYTAGVLTKNQPKIESLPSAEFLFDPTAKRISDADYCIHRRIVTRDFLRRKEIEGIYKNVDKIKTFNLSLDDDGENLRRAEEQYTSNYFTENKARQTIIINEYWGKIDVNDDGLLENVIVTFTGDVILSVEENTFDMYPFFSFSPFPSAYKIPGMGIGELVEDIQFAKTSFVRELLENIRKNNDRKVFYKGDAFPKISEMNDPTKKYVYVDRTFQLNDILFPEPFEQLSPNLMGMVEYLDQQRQFNTGISELKQGVNRNDRQTATEASIRYEATNAQTQMIAVVFANTLKELYEFIVYQNQKFIDEPQVIRLLNQPLVVDPDDLEGQFDLQVSVALGTGTAETRRNTLYNVLQVLLTVAEPKGLTDNVRIRNVLAKLLEESGLKDVDSYIVNESDVSNQQNIQQQRIDQQQAQIGQEIYDTQRSVPIDQNQNNLPID